MHAQTCIHLDSPAGEGSRISTIENPLAFIIKQANSKLLVISRVKYVFSVDQRNLPIACLRLACELLHVRNYSAGPYFDHMLAFFHAPDQSSFDSCKLSLNKRISFQSCKYEH